MLQSLGITAPVAHAPEIPRFTREVGAMKRPRIAIREQPLLSPTGEKPAQQRKFLTPKTKEVKLDAVKKKKKKLLGLVLLV